MEWNSIHQGYKKERLLRLSGTGSAHVSVTVAGDLDHNGTVDGADSTAFETLLTAGGNSPTADLNGDGLVNSTDRQLLYANYGWQANLPPVASSSQPTTLTHTGLSVRIPLDAIAQDQEGDSLFWRVLGSSHGSATLSRDGQSVIFTPEAGYSGTATVTLVADDGYAESAPISLGVNVSDAPVTAIHLAPLGQGSSLAPGQTLPVTATVDFADQSGVVITDPS